MTTELKKIKEELKGFSQVELPYDIKINTPVKYLCIKDNQEKFYIGGKFVRFGNDCLVLSNGSNNWSVNKYIKEKYLQSDIEGQKKIITPDEKLEKLLKTLSPENADKGQLNFFNIQKFLSPHFLKQVNTENTENTAKNSSSKTKSVSSK